MLYGYVVFSKVNESFTAPMFFKGDREAVHSFLKFKRDVPFEDKGLYDFWCICEFDEKCAVIKPLDPPDRVDVDAIAEDIYGSVNDEEIE